MIEFSPPRVSTLRDFLHRLRDLVPYVDTINIAEPLPRHPDHAYHHTLYTATQIRQHYPIDVIPYLTCRDHNRRDLQSLLLAAADAQLDTLLLLAGDHAPPSHHYSQEVRELYPSQLLHFIHHTFRPHHPDPALDFCLGTAYNTNHPDQPRQRRLLHRKLAAGAHYIHTQIILDVEQARSALEQLQAAGLHAPLIAELTVPKSSRHLHRLRTDFGITVPPELDARLRSVEEASPGPNGTLLNPEAVLRTGVDITRTIARHLRPHVKGICLSWASATAALDVVTAI